MLEKEGISSQDTNVLNIMLLGQSGSGKQSLIRKIKK